MAARWSWCRWTSVYLEGPAHGFNMVADKDPALWQGKDFAGGAGREPLAAVASRSRAPSSRSTDRLGEESDALYGDRRGRLCRPPPGGHRCGVPAMKYGARARRPRALHPGPGPCVLLRRPDRRLRGAPASIPSRRTPRCWPMRCARTGLLRIWSTCLPRGCTTPRGCPWATRPPRVTAAAGQPARAVRPVEGAGREPLPDRGAPAALPWRGSRALFDWSPDSPGFLSEWLVRAASERTFTLDSDAGCSARLHPPGRCGQRADRNVHRRRQRHLQLSPAALVSVQRRTGRGLQPARLGHRADPRLARATARRDAAPGHCAASALAPRDVRDVVASYLEGIKPWN